MTDKDKSKYMAVDGHALIHRGFHAMPGLTVRKTGEPIGAVYGFTMILLKAIKDLKPTHIACCFDLDGKTFRHEQYKEYKAHRVETPAELSSQIPLVKEVVRALNIPIFEKEGFEADDVLGTIAEQICHEYNPSPTPPLMRGGKGGVEVMIVTGDLDTLQLVNECVKIYTLRKGLTDTAVYDIEAIKQRYGLIPAQMIDYKALRGDPSDNIKGVKGIGEKTAQELIQHFGSLEKLYEAISSKAVSSKQVRPRVLQLLIDGEKDARLSYELSKIDCNVSVEIDIPEYEFTDVHRSEAIELFKKFEFRSLVDKLPVVSSKLVSSKSEEEKSQISNIKYQTNSKIKIQNSVDSNPQLVNSLTRNISIGKQDYQLIDTKEKLAKLINQLKKQSEFTLDTESTSLNIIDARLVGISICFKAGEAYYVPANIINSELKTILQSKVKLIGHNIKYDFHILQSSGISLGNPHFDTMIASYLLNAGTRQHNLDTLAFNELGYQMQPITDLIGTAKQLPPWAQNASSLPLLKQGGAGGVLTMDQVPQDIVSWYAAEDADMTFRLKEIFKPKLEQEGLDKIFREIEMPLIPVLADMERNGIKVDVNFLHKLAKQAASEIENLQKIIHTEAGQDFNINSPKQLKEILFEKLHLPTEGNRKTKTGLSTAAGELEKMLGLHPIIEKILEYRELTKLQNTYLEALPEMVNKTTGRIHTSYNQTIAATGRLSSTDPNLQNIPIKGDGLGSQIRQAFVAEKGFKLVSFDYSQMELRIVAHLSKDKNMMQVFERGEDIHDNTARAIFGLPSSPSPVEGEVRGEVTKDMRRHAKTVNFGIIYGLSAFGLSSRVQEVAFGDAKEFIEKYFTAYPGVKKYMEDIKAEVRKNGLVKNELGRVRKFPEIHASNFAVRGAAERAAINFPIQSLQADIIKIAMIDIQKVVSSKLISSKRTESSVPSPHEGRAREGLLNADCQMLLQVHDELVFEIREDKVEHYIKLIKPLMENAYKLSVPVIVDTKAGDNWGEMEGVDI